MMNSQLVKLSFDQGYEDTLVALGLKKEAFVGAAVRGLMTGAKFLGRGLGFMKKPLATGATAPKNIMGNFGRAVDVAGNPVTQIGASLGYNKLDNFVTNATA